MSKPSTLDELDLMQYADGELDKARADAVAEHAESNGDARAALAGLDEIHETLRTHLELAADDAQWRLDELWATIEQRIQGNGVPARTGALPARGQDENQSGERRGLWAAIGDFFAGWRGHFVTGAMAATAAAVVILAVRPAETVIVEKPVAVGAPATPGIKLVGDDRVRDRARDESSPLMIEHLEVNDGSGTVFVMPSEGDDDVSATVIFVDLNNDVEEPL